MFDPEQADQMVAEPPPVHGPRPARAPSAGPAPPAGAPPSLRAMAGPPDPSADPTAGEAELVRRSQAGDRQAFEEIVRRTARLLFSKLYLETGDAHRAEDLVQEALLIAWRNVRQVTEPQGFRSWLFAITHSVLVDSARREGRKKRGGRPTAAAGLDPASEAMRIVPDPAPMPDESAEQEERRRRVLGILRSMPEEYRMPITLRYLGGADYETIGRQLGLSNGSLRGLLNRGMARLREKLKGLDL